MRGTIPRFEWPPFFGAMGFSVVLLIWVLSQGCAGRNPLTIYRPNARTPLEQTAYNTLLVSERIITEAENSNAAGELPEFMRPIIDGLIVAHNAGRDAAALYVAAIGLEGERIEAENLGPLLIDLDKLISRIFGGGGGP